jgi:hypothetical protein
MNSRRRLINYILLNVFVSAVVSGMILFFYDRAYQKKCVTSLPDVTQAVGGIQANILSIAGAGTPESEIVTIQNAGSEPLVLTGWYLQGSPGFSYTFPQLVLHPGAVVQVHTISGQDTATDLFAGRSQPLWESGGLAALYDSHNVARAFYRVP